MATEKREPIGLIGSDKVTGTAVYGTDGEKIGHIQHVMIEKVSGKVSYAVLSFGGFLGIGDDYYPLPWSSLKYNVDLGGYQTTISAEVVRGAPRYARSGSSDWEDHDRTISINDYYGASSDSPLGAGGFPASDENFRQEWTSIGDKLGKNRSSS